MYGQHSQQEKDGWTRYGVANTAQGQLNREMVIFPVPVRA